MLENKKMDFRLNINSEKKILYEFLQLLPDDIINLIIQYFDTTNINAILNHPSFYLTYIQSVINYLNEEIFILNKMKYRILNEKKKKIKSINSFEIFETLLSLTDNFSSILNHSLGCSDLRKIMESYRLGHGNWYDLDKSSSYLNRFATSLGELIKLLKSNDLLNLNNNLGDDDNTSLIKSSARVFFVLVSISFASFVPFLVESGLGQHAITDIIDILPQYFINKEESIDIADLIQLLQTSINKLRYHIRYIFTNKKSLSAQPPISWLEPSFIMACLKELECLQQYEKNFGNTIQEIFYSCAKNKNNNKNKCLIM